MSEFKKLKIGFVASGTRGEIQPYLALAIMLRDRGHTVALATEKRMKSLVEEFGIEYRFIEGDPAGLLFQPNAQKPLKEGSLLTLISLTKEWEKQWKKTDIFNSYISALEGFDVIIPGNLSLMPAYCAAEKHHAAYVPMILGPTYPTSEFPIWALAGMIPMSCLYKWSYDTCFKLLWSSERNEVNSWRQSIGLEPIVYNRGLMDIIDKRRIPLIIAASPQICPHQRVPFDYPDFIKFQGFVFSTVKDEKVIDSKLIDFIETSDPRPIVYLGFGSMPAPNVNELLDLAVDICRLSNTRGVLVGGWSVLDKSDENTKFSKAVEEGTIFSIKAVPHDWLFPRMACVTHHGGIGTVAASLRAGVPQVPCPFMLDQPHNSELLIRMGCSPGYVKYDKYITAAKISNMILKAITKPPEGENTFVARAKELGAIIREESAKAAISYCEVIESAEKL